MVPLWLVQVAYHMYGDILREVKMFEGAEEIFMKDIAALLIVCAYGPMEYVFDEDEPVDRMFVICVGHVQIEDWQGDQLHTQWGLQAPDTFGSWR